MKDRKLLHVDLDDIMEKVREIGAMIGEGEYR
jgi:hypothetical protein